MSFILLYTFRTFRLIAPGIEAKHLIEDTTSRRALDTLYDYGVTELRRLIAAHAAACLGLTPTFAHLDSSSFHVYGRYNSAEASAECVIHITDDCSRDHYPDLNQVMLELSIEIKREFPS